MKNLQEATERICELKGSQVATAALLPALIEALPERARLQVIAAFEANAEAARTALLHADISELVLATFERDIALNRKVLGHPGAPPPRTARPTVDALLLATTRISTFAAGRVLTSASGFFFRRNGRLYLVSNRHVFADSHSSHFPDHLEIGVHTDTADLSHHLLIGLPLYRNGLRLWREASDSGGAVDVAVIEVPAGQIPYGAVLHAFEEAHLLLGEEDIAIGDPLTIAGFPLGFHDTVHHLAVARSAVIASAFGVRFQRQGCFLTDARTHRGSSGSPVVRRCTSGPLAHHPLAWQLLGVHSTRLDMRSRDLNQDESLGLNSAWYADVLIALTQDP